MYSLLFIAAVKDEYKFKCEELKKTHDAKIQELYKKHKIPYDRAEDSIAAKIKYEIVKDDPLDLETYVEKARETFDKID